MKNRNLIIVFLLATIATACSSGATVKNDESENNSSNITRNKFINQHANRFRSAY